MLSMCLLFGVPRLTPGKRSLAPYSAKGSDILCALELEASCWSEPGRSSPWACHTFSTQRVSVILLGGSISHRVRVYL